MKKIPGEQVIAFFEDIRFKSKPGDLKLDSFFDLDYACLCGEKHQFHKLSYMYAFGNHQGVPRILVGCPNSPVYANVLDLHSRMIGKNYIETKYCTELSPGQMQYIQNNLAEGIGKGILYAENFCHPDIIEYMFNSANENGYEIKQIVINTYEVLKKNFIYGFYQGTPIERHPNKNILEHYFEQYVDTWERRIGYSLGDRDDLKNGSPVDLPL